MACSSDQVPRGTLFAQRWKVFQYFHIANRYCTNAAPLATGRLRHPTYLIVDTGRIREWEEGHPHLPCPNCVMTVQKGIMGQSENYERTDLHGYGRMRHTQEDVTLQVEEVSFNWQWAYRKEIQNRWSGWEGAWWIKDGKVHIEILCWEFVAPIFSKFRPHWTRFWQKTIRSEVTVETSKKWCVTVETSEVTVTVETSKQWRVTVETSEVSVTVLTVGTKQTPKMLTDWVIEDVFHLETEETGWIVN